MTPVPVLVGLALSSAGHAADVELMLDGDHVSVESLYAKDPGTYRVDLEQTQNQSLIVEIEAPAQVALEPVVVAVNHAPQVRPRPLNGCGAPYVDVIAGVGGWPSQDPSKVKELLEPCDHDGECLSMHCGVPRANYPWLDATVLEDPWPEEQVCLPGGPLFIAHPRANGCRVNLTSELAPEPPATELDREDVHRWPFGLGWWRFRFRVCEADDQPVCWSMADADADDHFVITESPLAPVVTVRFYAAALDGPPPAEADVVFAVRAERDQDGDGLWDDWETSGIDTDGDGQADVSIPDADPQHKDLYLEIDHMVGHEPDAAAIDLAVGMFLAAPVQNPDGVDGIDLHLNVDDELPYSPNATGCPSMNGLASYVPDHFLDHPGPRWYSHYQLWAAVSDGSSGCASRSGQLSVVSLTEDDVPTHPWDIAQAGTLIHELGHNLGLMHGGAELDERFHPNFLSSVNYAFQLSGVPLEGGAVVIDYSREELPPLVETELDESAGIGLPATGDYLVRWRCDAEQPLTWAPTDDPAGIDWNCSKAIDPQLVVQDISWAHDAGGGVQTTFQPKDVPFLGRDEWAELRLDFQSRYGTHIYLGVQPEPESEVGPAEPTISQLLISAGQGGPTYASWGTVGRTPSRRGQAPELGPRVASAGAALRTNGIVVGAPVVRYDGTVLVSTDLGLEAFDARGGAAWTVPLSGATSPAVTVDGHILVGAADGLRALERDGSVLWSVTLTAGATAAPTVGPDGSIYLPTGLDLHAFEGDGTPRWTRTFSAVVTGPVAIDDSNRVLVAAGSALHAVSALNGSDSWMAVASAPITAGPVVTHDQAALVGTSAGTLLAFDPVGQLRWTHVAAAAFAAAPAVAADGVVVAASEDGTVQALDPDGRALWSSHVGASIGSAPVLDAAGTAYVANDAGLVVSIAQGNVLWKVDLGRQTWTSSPVLQGGGLWVATPGAVTPVR